MNFLKKTFVGSSSTQAKTSDHGTDFHIKLRRYIEIEALLQKLQKEVKNYVRLWGELLANKTQIYGYLLYFYSDSQLNEYNSHENKYRNTNGSNFQSEKHNLINELFMHHNRTMDKYIIAMSHAYEDNLMSELRTLLNIFPFISTNIGQLHHKKQAWKQKQQYYKQLKKQITSYSFSGPNAVSSTSSKSYSSKSKSKRSKSRSKNVLKTSSDFDEITKVDLQCRTLYYSYDVSRKRLLHEFDHKLENKASLLDRFVSRVMCALLIYLYTHTHQKTHVYV